MKTLRDLLIGATICAIVLGLLAAVLVGLSRE